MAKGNQKRRDEYMTPEEIQMLIARLMRFRLYKWSIGKA